MCARAQSRVRSSAGGRLIVCDRSPPLVASSVSCDDRLEFCDRSCDRSPPISRFLNKFWCWARVLWSIAGHSAIEHSSTIALVWEHVVILWGGSTLTSLPFFLMYSQASRSTSFFDGDLCTLYTWTDTCVFQCHFKLRIEGSWKKKIIEKNKINFLDLRSENNNNNNNNNNNQLTNL